MPHASILYVTLGCAKNEVDTDRMRSLLNGAGYDEVFEADQADAVIINTCSFLASATSESIDDARPRRGGRRGRAGHAHRDVRLRPLPVWRRPARRAPRSRRLRPQPMRRTGSSPSWTGCSASSATSCRTSPASSAHRRERRRLRQDLRRCDRFCSFCAIPYIRGRYHSRSAEDIIAEVRELVAGGVREIVLIGQDTGIWGTDFTQGVEGPANLAQLMVAVSEAVPSRQVWIRVLYLQPEGMTDELIAAIRDTPEVLPYIDIPVQHCNARIQGQAPQRVGGGADAAVRQAARRDPRHGHPHHEPRGLSLRDRRGGRADARVSWIARAFDYTSVFPTHPRRARVPPRWTGRSMMTSSSSAPRRPWTWRSRSVFAATAAHVGEVAEVIVDGVEETGRGASS